MGAWNITVYACRDELMMVIHLTDNFVVILAELGIAICFCFRDGILNLFLLEHAPFTALQFFVLLAWHLPHFGGTYATWLELRNMLC